MLDELDRLQVAEALVEELSVSGEWVPPELLQAILAFGDLAAEPLIGLLRTDIADDTPTIYSVTYAALLLGHLGATDAVPVLCDEIRHYDEDILEEIARGLGSLGAPAVEPCLELLADRELSWYQRAMAGNAARTAAGDDPALIERYRQVLRQELRAYIDRHEGASEDDMSFVGSLVVDLAELRNAEDRPLLEEAFGKELVDLLLVDRPTVADIYSGRLGPTHPWTVGDLLTTYPQRYARHVARLRSTLRIAMNVPIPGRNDPCWCGSGKKYKQCHWADDQLASRSLWQG